VGGGSGRKPIAAGFYVPGVGRQCVTWRTSKCIWRRPCCSPSLPGSRQSAEWSSRDVQEPGGGGGGGGSLRVSVAGGGERVRSGELTLGWEGRGRNSSLLADEFLYFPTRQ